MGSVQVAVYYSFSAFPLLRRSRCGREKAPDALGGAAARPVDMRSGRAEGKGTPRAHLYARPTSGTPLHANGKAGYCNNCHFNVLYIWNEYPYASVMLKDVSDYTLSMGASFFKGNYTVDYGGIVASSLMIIVPELIFYGLFQKNIVEGMTAGAVKG